MRLAIITTFVLGTAFTTGCSKGSTEELSCPEVADKVVSILKSEMGNLEEAQRTALTAQLATVRSELIEDCKKDPDFFTSKSPCIMKATSKNDLEGCETRGKGNERPAE